MVALLFLVGTTFMANANENISKNYNLVVKDQGKKLELFYTSDEVKNVKIRIVNSKGKILFSEKINSDRFLRPYDLSSLKDGKYFLEISVDGVRTKEEFIKGSNHYSPNLQHVKITKNQESEEKFVFTAISDIRDTFSIKIFNEYGVLVHHSYEDINPSFSKVFVLKKADVKDYTVEVTNSRNKILKKEGSSLIR